MKVGEKMCEFCENITNKDKEITWLVRSTYADDNICEYANDNNCSLCDGCQMKFVLDGYEYNDDIYVCVVYEQKLNKPDGIEVIIHPFSESMKFNYCPICGKQISKKISDFKDYYELRVEINDKE